MRTLPAALTLTSFFFLLFVSSIMSIRFLSKVSQKVCLSNRILNVRRFSTQPVDGGIGLSNPAAEQTTPLPQLKTTELSLLEIRVGKIVEIAKHPEADSLYVEKVDVGEPSGPRTIVSGLVKFCTEETLLNRHVIVLCNLKPRPLKGIASHGMLLCASNSDHTMVEPLTPPEGAIPGELIKFEGHASTPVEPGNKATKAFSKIADDFFVDDNFVATYKGIPFLTPQGLIKSSLKGKIS